MQAKHPILILGGTGHVGRALAAVWPVDVPAVWQYRPGAAAPAGPSVAWDILNDPAPDMGAISGIVQLAGGVTPAALAVTTDLARLACDLGAALGVPVLVASSQAVYGAAPGHVTEATPCAPASAYGRAKLAMEHAVAGRATCLRIGNVVGCDMLLRNAAQGRVTLDQLPDGTSPQRSYISAQTLAQVCIGLVGQGRGADVVNVAQPGTVAMHELLKAAGLGWDWRRAGPGVLARLEMDVTRLMGLVPLPDAEADTLIADARRAGWGPA